MTILDKIHKARELVAAMDATPPKHSPLEAHIGWLVNNAEAADAAIALLRDDELLELGDEVERLRKERRTILGDIEALNWDDASDEKIAELQAKWWGYKKTAERAEAAEAKLAAAEVDARRYRYWRENHGWTGYFDCGASNGETAAEVDAAIDAAIGAGE